MTDNFSNTNPLQKYIGYNKLVALEMCHLCQIVGLLQTLALVIDAGDILTTKTLKKHSQTRHIAEQIPIIAFTHNVEAFEKGKQTFADKRIQIRPKSASRMKISRAALKYGPGEVAWLNCSSQQIYADPFIADKHILVSHDTAGTTHLNSNFRLIFNTGPLSVRIIYNLSSSRKSGAKFGISKAAQIRGLALIARNCGYTLAYKKDFKSYIQDGKYTRMYPICVQFVRNDIVDSPIGQLLLKQRD